MASWYIDHGCTLYPTTYMSVPVGAGSFPQEGDGEANGLGTTPAVSVATMNFSAATAAAGATIVIMGATLTCVASGAVANQFNAGTGTTLAANIATSINAATANPTTTTGGIATPHLKGLVWASAASGVLTVYSRIASAKLAMPLAEAFWRGVLCNLLVCMAVWMALGGRSLTDKVLAIVFPVTAFVAAGFEHSIANLYFFPLALLLGAPLDVLALLACLAAVIAGNLVGGSVLVALVYWVIYLRPAAARAPHSPLADGVPPTGDSR